MNWCDECGEIEVPRDGDVCAQCEEDLIEMEADLLWSGAIDGGGFTPGEW